MTIFFEKPLSSACSTGIGGAVGSRYDELAVNSREARLIERYPPATRGEHLGANPSMQVGTSGRPAH